MKLFEIVGYHGSPSKNAKLKPPIFVALDRSGAAFYATSTRGSSKRDGFFYKGKIVVKKALDVRKGHDKLFDIAKKAGVNFTYDDSNYFQSPDVAKHRPNDGFESGGTNENDLIYVPKFLKALKAAGFDSMRVHDVLGQEMLDVFILTDSSQFVVTEIIPANEFN